MKLKFLFTVFFLILLSSIHAVWAATDFGIYVANRDSNNVSVIDPSTDIVTTTIPVGTQPESLQTLPDASFVYVVNAGSNNVSVIDTSSDTVTTTINVGQSPSCIAVDPSGDFVYVTNRNENSVSVIDTSSNTVVATITVGTTPRGCAVNPAGTFLYVGNSVDDTISVIDLSNDTVTNTIALAEFADPLNLLVNNAGTKLYVSNFLLNSVSEINTSNNTVTQSLNVGTEPFGMVLTADDSSLFIFNALDNTFNTISASTVSLSISGTGNVSTFPRQGVLNSAESKLYVAESLADTVGVVNTSSLTRTSGIVVGTNPFDITLARTVATLQLSASSLTFSETNSGDTSVEQTVTLTSTGTEALDITSITTSGDFAETDDCGTTVAVNSSCTLSVTFTPTTSGDRTGSISIVSDADSSPDTITLTGTGTSIGGTEDVQFTITSALAEQDVAFEGDFAFLNQYRGNAFYTAKNGTRYITNGSFFFAVLTVTNSGTEDATTSYIMEPSRSTSGLIETGFLYVGGHYYDTYVYDATGTTLQQQLVCGLTSNCNLGTFAAGETKVIKISEEVSVDGGGIFSVGTFADSMTFTVGSESAGVSTSNTLSMPVANDNYVSCGCNLTARNKPLSYSFITMMGALLLPILPFLMLRFRKAKSKGVLIAVMLCLLLGGKSAHAATTQYSVLADTPVVGSTGTIYTLGSKTIANKFNFALDNDYGYSYRRTNLNTNGLINHLLVHNFGFTFSPSDRVQFDLIAPVFSYNRFYNTSTGTYDAKAGIGDLLLRTHFNFWRSRDDSKGLALIPFLSLPTGNENISMGDKYPRGGLLLSGDWNLTDRLYSVLNLGFEARQTVNDLNFQTKGRILSNLGLAYRLCERFVVNSDAMISTAITRPWMDKSTTSVELMGGVSYTLKNHPVTFNLSAGAPILQTAMQPQFRTNLGVTIGFGNKKSALTLKEKQELQPTIYFDTNLFDIKTSDQKVLNRVVALLKKHPQINIIVAEGHTDSVGTKKHNQALSIDRANATKKYLISKHISANRIKVEGFGETKPATSNKTLKGKAKNRRVELKVE